MGANPTRSRHCKRGAAARRRHCGRVDRGKAESLATIRHLGFHAQAGPAANLEPEDLHLAVDCPFCGKSNKLPSGPGGMPSLAECDRCDVFFDYAPAEVYAAGPAIPNSSVRLRDGVADPAKIENELGLPEVCDPVDARLLELRLEVAPVAVGVAEAFGLAQAHAVDD